MEQERELERSANWSSASINAALLAGCPGAITALSPSIRTGLIVTRPWRPSAELPEYMRMAWSKRSDPPTPPTWVLIMSISIFNGIRHRLQQAISRAQQFQFRIPGS